MSASLATRLAELEAELKALRIQLDEQQRSGGINSNGPAAAAGGRGSSGANVDGGGAPSTAAPAASPPTSQPPAPPFVSPHGLTKDQAERYSRQVLLPAFGPAAQARLLSRSALIVGCGGLGAPAALYLAAAGVGRIGLVDRDAVEASNLHRQVIHTEAAAANSVHKADSAAAALRALNSSLVIEVHRDGLTAQNAAGLVAKYDVVLDASDNAPTRYLLSDAAVAAGRRPLVSAAAVGTEGQLTVYNHGADGPCYRCLFPQPPAPDNCARCADAGVLGPVPGVLGVLQALEAVKILAGVGAPLSRRLLIFDALDGRFTTVKLRARAPNCYACGTNSGGDGNENGSNGASEEERQNSSSGAGGGRMSAADVAAFDYVAFTGQAPHDGPPPPLAVLPPEQRLRPREFARRIAAVAATAVTSADGGLNGAAAPAAAAVTEGSSRCVLIDVRPGPQFETLALPGAVNVPFHSPERFAREGVPRILELASGGGGGNGTGSDGPSQQQEQEQGGSGGGASSAAAVYVLCRRGNHSQLAVRALRAAGVAEAYDLAGGLEAWARELDPSMPVL